MQAKYILNMRQQFSNEFLDKLWNYYKLTQISRKQGYPNLAIHYLTLLSKENSYTFDSEGTKYEKFKFDYEYIKLQLDYNPNPESLSKFVENYCSLINNRYLEPYKQM